MVRFDARISREYTAQKILKNLRKKRKNQSVRDGDKIMHLRKSFTRRTRTLLSVSTVPHDRQIHQVVGIWTNDLGSRVQLGHLSVGEFEQDGAEVVFQVMQLSGADDRRSDAGTLDEPTQRHLRHGLLGFFGDLSASVQYAPSARLTGEILWRKKKKVEKKNERTDRLLGLYTRFQTSQFFLPRRRDPQMVSPYRECIFRRANRLWVATKAGTQYCCAKKNSELDFF